jgi:hypothetical protein
MVLEPLEKVLSPRKLKLADHGIKRFSDIYYLRKKGTELTTFLLK